MPQRHFAILYLWEAGNLPLAAPVITATFGLKSYYRKLWIDDGMKKAAYPSA
jgi:hypothetical protein